MRSARDGSPSLAQVNGSDCNPSLNAPRRHFPSTGVSSGRHPHRPSEAQPLLCSATLLLKASYDIRILEPVYADCISRRQRQLRKTESPERSIR